MFYRFFLFIYPFGKITRVVTTLDCHSRFSTLVYTATFLSLYSGLLLFHLTVLHTGVI